ncbi:MAG: hypothetical protein IPN53_11680 [Comamonadaceae bacterium]|nr:hypothetical protein [Comamonadaceae bacterium]
MSRYLDNLDRLCGKWGGRLGADDALYLQLKDQADSCRVHRLSNSLQHDWSETYDTFVKRQQQAAVSQQLQ